MPHQPKDEELRVIVPANIAKAHGRMIELEFAKERPMGCQDIPSPGNKFSPGLTWTLEVPFFELVAKNIP